MDELINSEIRLDEISGDDKKVTIKFNRDKYSFWKSKKDGNKTKAYESWLQFNPQVGDWLEIQFKEEDAEWVKDGKTIFFKRRTILQLHKGDGTSESPKSSPSAPQRVTAPTGDFVTREEYAKKISDMSEAFMGLIRDFAQLNEKVESHMRDYPSIK
jgi:hypothetical protein